MRDGSGSDETGRRARLREAALAELERGGLALAFDEPLRSRYASSQAKTRPAELMAAARFGCIAYAGIVLAINCFVVAAPNWRGVAEQVLIVPPVILLAAQIFLQPDRSETVREGGALLICTVFSVATILSVTDTPGARAMPEFFLAALPVIFVLIFVRPRFNAAVFYTAFSIGGLAAALAYRTDLPAEFRPYPLGFLVAAAVPALAAVHGLERAARRVFLHGVLQELHIEELAQQNQKLQKLSNTDALTGTANRRRLDAVLAERCAAPFTEDFLLLLDLDHFKQFNDQHGHLAGDAYLVAIAGVLQEELRANDLLARFGGEEFAIFVPRSNAAAALDLAERLRAAVAAFAPPGLNRVHPQTVSIGIADRDRDSDPTLLIARADAALYAAKRAGRNCIRQADTVWSRTARFGT